MSSIVVADANIFVFLIKSGAFEIVFDQTKIQVLVPKAVVNEIKTGLISRKYPDVTERFNKALHGGPQNDVVNLSQLSIDEVRSETTIRYYLELENAAELGKGEIECITLCKEHGHLFLSGDESAIQECLENNVPHVSFENFVQELYDQRAIDAAMLEAILVVLRS